MIRRKINLVQWWFTIVNFLIPLPVFSLAAYIRFGTGHFEQVDVDVYAYLSSVLAFTFIWAFIVEHYHLNRVETICGSRLGLSSRGPGNGCTRFGKRTLKKQPTGNFRREVFGLNDSRIP